MPNVVREIHIDAPPADVRRHVSDPTERRGWLDDPDLTPVPDHGDGLRFRRSGDREADVHIEVLPDGDGSRVRVTETLAPPDVAESEDATVHLLPRHDDAPTAMARAA